VIRALLLFALCAPLFLYGLGGRPLWDIDEGMHSATSKVIVTSGDWIVPTHNGEPFRDKPILHNWFVALAFLGLGFTELAARLPAALLGLLTVVVTWFLGRSLLGARAALLSGAALATTMLWMVMSRTVTHDISLAFFVTASMALFWAAYRSTERRGRCMLLFHAAVGFAVLAKGPLGIVLPGLAIGAFLLSQRRPGFVKEMRLGLGALIVVAIAAPWYVAVSLADPGYASGFFLRKNIGGFLSGGGSHVQPFYYYGPGLLGGFLPWSFVLPVAAYHVARGAKRAASEVREPAAAAFLLSWVGTGLVFFSAAAAKLITYILPLFPGLALMVGWLFADLFAAGRARYRAGLALGHAFAVAVALAAACAVWIWPPPDLEAKYGLELSLLAPLAIFLLAFAALGAFAVARARPRTLFASYAALAVGVLGYFTLVVAPVVDDYRSMKGLLAKMEPLLAPGEGLAFFERIKESALFYSDRRCRALIQPEEVEQHLAAGERVFLFNDQKNMHELAALEGKAFPVYQEGEVVVLSNRPGRLFGYEGPIVGFEGVPWETGARREESP